MKRKETISVPDDVAKRIFWLSGVVKNLGHNAVLVNSTVKDTRFKSHDEIGRRGESGTLIACEASQVVTLF